MQITVTESSDDHVQQQKYQKFFKQKKGGNKLISVTIKESMEKVKCITDENKKDMSISFKIALLQISSPWLIKAILKLKGK